MVYLLPHIVDAAAERHPDTVAFQCAGEQITYAALAVRTNRLANVLAEQGVRPGGRVGIYLPKGLEGVVALFGIMKAGAAYVPLDPHTPVARLAAIIENSGIRHLITHAAKRPQLRELGTMNTGLRSLVGPAPMPDVHFPALSWADVETAPAAARPQGGRTEQDLAYLMYTSGSTGAPKGIMHTHASGLAYARLAAAVYDLRPDDRLSGFPPLHFDQSTFHLFSGPLAGATTVIIPEMYMLMPASLSTLMQEERLTVWYSVPHALIQLLLRGVLADRDLTSLRWVLFGGEVFPTKHLRALMLQWPQARFSNVYGPAEVNQCTYYHVPPLPDDEVPLPIGPVWSNTEALVLNGADQVVDQGDVGEFVVRTPAMMRGYWNRPDLNARAFFHRPRGGGIPDVFYRTGDLVYLNAEGQYVFMGRKDRQIKTRGYRVELDEVEAVLLTHPALAEAAVFTVPDAQGTQQIHAAVSLRAGATLAPDELRSHTAAHLPRYAVPSHIAVVDEFPRTSSGKINRRVLQDQAPAPNL